MKIEELLVTPILAEVLLKNNKFNRPVSEKNIAFISDQMKKGSFKSNTGETIKISKTGNLLDGQHRLYGIIRSGIDQKMLVVSDLEDEVFSVLDTGKKRSAGDVLSINGIKSGSALATAIRAIKIITDYKSDFSKSLAITNTEVLEFINNNEELYDIFRFCENATRKKFTSISSNHVTAIYYLLLKKGYLPEKIDKFIELYSTGLGLDSIDPIYILRNRLIIDSQSKSKLSSKNKLALFVHTWNLWIRNKTCKVMYTPTEFPKII